jgi:hypothetical protein
MGVYFRPPEGQEVNSGLVFHGCNIESMYEAICINRQDRQDKGVDIGLLAKCLVFYGKVHDTLHYMHFNPVERGLVSRPEDWPWSSLRCFGGSGKIPLEIDRLELPFDDDARL